MSAMPGLRGFSVAAVRCSGRVSCTANGVFVGDIPLLRRVSTSTGNVSWTVRPVDQLNFELATRYRLPIDITVKTGSLALIANALSRGDLAMAAIATVQMQFPDPPPLTKYTETHEEFVYRATELSRSRLLKEWDPDKHPRAGTPPNRAWFAPVPKTPASPVYAEMDSETRDHPERWFRSVESMGGGASEDLFGGRLPIKLPEYVPKGKTYGVLQTPQRNIPLESGYDGPAKSMPPESLGFDGVTKGHVEGHAAALMWQDGITEGTLYINNPEICVSCEELLPRMLPPGSTLNVILPDGTVRQFKGIAR